MKHKYLPICIFLVMSINCCCWIWVAKGNPFQSSPSPNATALKPGIKDRILNSLQETQQELRRAVAGRVREFNKSKTALLFLLIAASSFLFGVVHAVGPGHGKTLVMSYILYEKRPKLIRGLLAGIYVAFGEAIAAILLVYSIYYLALGRITSSFQQAEGKIRMVCYAAVFVIGTILLLFRLFKHLPGSRLRKPENTPEVLKSSRGLLVIVLLGLIPCPGVMLLLIFMLAAGLPVFGILFGVCMAFGMALTISAFSIAAVLAKKYSLQVISGESRRIRHFETFIELIGALMIVIFSGIMLFTN
jgi:nickel/cobalt transporter (NicO) family protein